MSLPAPNLDDRRFQDLVDDAKRMVQRKWPEWTGWTDHNVSDPGVTLIETFAFMVDQLLYRLNRVPDRTYVKLLELIGLQLQAPTAAVAPVTFWLAAPQPVDVSVPKGTEVATERTDTADPVVFRTTTDLTIVSVSQVAVASSPADGGAPADHTDPLSSGAHVALFSANPRPGDCFYVGLSQAAPSCAVVLRFDGNVEGYGIDPDRPPIAWQAWDGAQWAGCDVERDETGGFNREGDVVLHIPAGHRVSSVAQRRAGWLRCIVTVPEPGAQPYNATPQVTRVEALSIGGTVDAVHAEEVRSEILGLAEGAAGQRLVLEHQPVVLAPDPEVLEVIVDEPDGVGGSTGRVEEWIRVDSFADKGSDDRCFMIEPANGAVRLPPAVREANGTIRRFGAVPPVGATLRLRSYRIGGGRRGNVAGGTLRSIRSSLPLVSSAENRVAAAGGVDAESIEEAKNRGPLLLRTRDRAVTAGDFEHLAREAAPDIARVRCADAAWSEPGAVRVLVVPHVHDGPDGAGRLRVDQLRPSSETLERIDEYLQERRVVGVRVDVGIPAYQGVTVVARLRARRRAVPAEVERLALDALYGYYHPVIGGPDGEGWPFGRPVQAGEVHAVLQRCPGVDFVEEALLFTYDVNSRVRGPSPTERIEVHPNGLVLSYGHQVRVEPSL